MRRLHRQLPADVMVKLYYSLVYSHLTHALLAWGRSGLTNAAKIECAHRRARKLLTDYNHRILTFHSISDYFALLQAFNTNTINYHQYFKDKLSSHQPSHMHNTRHRTNSNFNTPRFNHSKTQKCYLYQVIPIWNSLPNSLKNCTSKFTFKKQIKCRLLDPNLSNFFNYIGIYFSSSSSPNYFRIFFCPISHVTLWAWFNFTILLANLLTEPSIFLLVCQLYIF